MCKTTHYDPSVISVHIAGEVKDFDVTDNNTAKEAKQLDTIIHFGLAAGLQAWRDSGLEVNAENAERIGVIVGSGIGGLPRIELAQTDYLIVGRGAFRHSFFRACLLILFSDMFLVTSDLNGPAMQG